MSLQQSLTFWKAKEGHHEQGPNATDHGSCSLPGEPRTASVSSIQMQLSTEATHFLKSREQASSAASK